MNAKQSKRLTTKLKRDNNGGPQMSSINSKLPLAKDTGHIRFREVTVCFNKVAMGPRARAPPTAVFRAQKGARARARGPKLPKR